MRILSRALNPGRIYAGTMVLAPFLTCGLSLTVILKWELSALGALESSLSAPGGGWRDQ